jgi:integrase
MKTEINKAKLSTANKKDWYVFWQDETGRIFKKRSGMNRIKSLPERKIFGRQLCDEINRLIQNGFELEPPALEVMRSIVDSKQSNWRHRTWQSYHYAINSFGRFLNDPDLRMADITRQHARAFLDDQLKSHQGKSVNVIRGFLTAIFNHYAERNQGYQNPFKGTAKAIELPGRNLAFTKQQQAHLWAVMNPELRLFTRFIYFTYIRPLELLRLRVGDIRFDLGQIVIGSHQSKNKRQQSVVIPDSFLPELSHLGTLPEDWYLFGRGLRPGPVSLGRNTVSKMHSKVLTAEKFSKDLTLYSWKHTGVVAAYRNKVDAYDIMRQLRHHSLDMTMIYLKSLGLERNERFARGMV